MLIASALTTSAGQAGLAVLVLIVGYVLHRKEREIKVLVDGRLDEALQEIKSLQDKLDAKDNG
jgi:hypothetical protein